MLSAGLLRVASQICLLLMVGAVFLSFVQEQANVFWYIVAGLFFIGAIFTTLKAKEQSIKAKVQIEEKERARIRARQG